MKKSRKMFVLSMLRLIFGLIASFITIFTLTTGRFELMPLMNFFLGVMCLTMGLYELEKQRKHWAFISFIASGFSIFVSIYISLF